MPHILLFVVLRFILFLLFVPSSAVRSPRPNQIQKFRKRRVLLRARQRVRPYPDGLECSSYFCQEHLVEVDLRHYSADFYLNSAAVYAPTISKLQILFTVFCNPLIWSNLALIYRVPDLSALSFLETLRKAKAVTSGMRDSRFFQKQCCSRGR